MAALMAGLIMTGSGLSMLPMSSAAFAAEASVSAASLEEDLIYCSDLDNGGIQISDYYGTETELVIPEKLTYEGKTKPVTRIANLTTVNQDTLKSVTIPSTVVDIYSFAFNSRSRLTEINVAEGNKKYKSVDGVLYSADGKTLLRCPRGYTGDENNVFEIPSSVTAIGEYAFSGCRSLSRIIVPASVTSIELYAFEDTCCEYIEIPGSVSDLNGWSIFPEGAVIMTDNICDDRSELNELAMYAKEHRLDLNLKEGSSYKTISGVIYSKDGKTLLYYPSTRTAGSFTVPDSVTKIGPKAFSYGQMRNVVLGKKVSAIGKEAFTDTENLNEIHMQGGVTSLGDFWYYRDGVDYDETPENNYMLHVFAPEGSATIDALLSDRTFYGCISYEDSDDLSMAEVKWSPKIVEYIWSEDDDCDSENYYFDPAGITVTLNGKQLTEGKDYVKACYGNTEPGTARMFIHGINRYCGTSIQDYRIAIIPKSYKLSKTTYVYSGKAKKPSVTVRNRNNGIISKSDYKVTYGSGRINVGTYNVTVKMKGSYYGSRTLQFKILPTPTGIRSLGALKSGFGITWTKKTKQVTGYQIRYSTNSTMKNSKVKTIKKNTVTSAKIKGLKTGKKYYVKVRTYKKVNGKNYYSSWSAKKAVRTK